MIRHTIVASILLPLSVIAGGGLVNGPIIGPGISSSGVLSVTDSALPAFIAANNLTDQNTINDLNGFFRALNATGHRADFVDGMLLAQRFNPTNLNTIMGQKMLIINGATWTPWGFNCSSPNNLNTSNNTNGNSTNGIAMTVGSLTTNTVVFTIRFNQNLYAAMPLSSDNPWCFDRENLFGLVNTNTRDGIWGENSINGSFGSRFVERSNSVQYATFFGGSDPHSFSLPSTAPAGNPGNSRLFYTATFCFTSDGHGKRQLWVDAIPMWTGSSLNATVYNSTNYPSTGLNQVIFGADTNWLSNTDSFGNNMKLFSGEVQSVQVYKCFADTNLVNFSFIAAQYIPDTSRSDFFDGDSIFQGATVISTTNMLSWVMEEALGQANWHDYSQGGTRLDGYPTNLANPMALMPRDKYTEIWEWTDIGRNDVANVGGSTVLAGVVYTNFMDIVGRHKNLPNMRLGVLASPGAGNGAPTQFGLNTNLFLLNQLLISVGYGIDRVFPSYQYVLTNAIGMSTNTTYYTTDGLHPNGIPGGAFLVKEMADGLLNRSFYDPIGNVYVK